MLNHSCALYEQHKTRYSNFKDSIQSQFDNNCQHVISQSTKCSYIIPVYILKGPISGLKDLMIQNHCSTPNPITESQQRQDQYIILLFQLLFQI